MALIACPDCEQNVSDSAPACPNCGRPIAPVQIEQTAKKHKAMMLVSFIVAIIGFVSVLVLSGANKPVWIGGVVAGLGVIGYFSGMFGAWWRNG